MNYVNIVIQVCVWEWGRQALGSFQIGGWLPEKLTT